MALSTLHSEKRSTATSGLHLAIQPASVTTFKAAPAPKRPVSNAGFYLRDAQLEQAIRPMSEEEKRRTTFFLSAMVVLASASTFLAMFFSGIAAY